MKIKKKIKKVQGILFDPPDYKQQEKCLHTYQFYSHITPHHMTPTDAIGHTSYLLQ